MFYVDEGIFPGPPSHSPYAIEPETARDEGPVRAALDEVACAAWGNSVTAKRASSFP